MAHVIVRRLWDGELVPLLLARLGEQRAAILAREIAHHSGQRLPSESIEGDIWVEVDVGLSSPAHLPTIFPIGLAGAPLVAIGVFGDLLTDMLSDATAAARDGGVPPLIQAVDD